ncbi:Vacuolar protein sorting-associated protein 72 -like protein [Trichinella pseudospiralis]|uniref:Conserved oligomeric Golgi complex subunit 3 n=1 Tax=Trichinella pseudospiralis TaxID=6337 RepID=A0A0V1JR62_TRIPS|nr:Vacuolar protein sorting-associated protein 72 -like protein [Trichinella pseudospiralis]
MASSRPKRCTAGNRMQELLATLPPTDEFFSSTYGGFTEEKDDTDYKYVDEGKDEFDSDFGSTSDEESDAQQDADEDDDEDLDEERKKKKFEFRRHLHLSSLQKKAQPSAAPTEVTSPPSKKKKPESNFFTTQTFDKQLRNSTLRKSELSAERRQKVAQSTIKRQKRVTNYQPLTLEQMLEEAKLTELENQESLKRFHEMELEKKQKQNQPKKIKLEGSRIRTTSVAVPIPVKYLDRQNHPFCNPDKKVTSKTYSATVSSLHTPQIHVKTVIEFSNAETYQSIFSRFSKKPTIEKPKRCVTNFTNEEQTENDSRILKFYRKVVNLTTTTFDESDTLHQPYILQLVENISDIAHSLNDATEKLRELNNKYRTVANRTISLHDACNQLMTSQKLNSPLLSVTGESFLHLLNLIDDGIVFMSDHTTYKDSAFYLSKYKHCLTKALTLVKTYVSRTFENSTKAILEKAKICGIISHILLPVCRQCFTIAAIREHAGTVLQRILLSKVCVDGAQPSVNRGKSCQRERKKLLFIDVTDVVYKGLAKVLEELLGDLTERLLYRSQMFAANEIGNYNPAEGDLAYPEKLIMIRVPVQTSEQVVDSRRHLDFTVKTACQNFIADSADVFVSEIKKYLTQVKAISNKNPNVDLARDCNFANPKIVSQLIANTYRMLKNNWPKFRDQLALYLCNVDIENTLATPVKRKIIAVLEEFVEVIKKRYSEEDVQLLRLPSSQEWHLLMS